MAQGSPLEDAFTPHEGQQAVLESDARTRVVIKGRRWGGSTLIAHDAVEAAIDEPGLEGWLFAPSKRAAEILWRYCEDTHPPADFLDNPPILQFHNGSTLRFCAASQPPFVSDKNDIDLPDYVAIDEADAISEGEYRGLASAADLESVERRLFVSTPIGYAEETNGYPGSWLYDYFMDGFKVGTETECWRFPTTSNPYVSDEVVSEHVEMLDDETGEQEFGGRWQ